MKYKAIFIESDFDTNIEESLTIKSPFKRQNKFRRIITDLWYLLRLVFVDSKTTIIAPWGLFWIPGILKGIKIKKFKIISLSCDTFLSEKTKNARKNGIVPKIKYLIAEFTHPEVNLFFFCSGVVHDQITQFGVSENKCVFEYREWVRDIARYERYKEFTPKLDSQNLLFIGQCYSTMQKRVDLLIEAFLEVKKKFPNATLTIVGRGWDVFFGEKMSQLKREDIIFTGEDYSIDKYLNASTFYIHPGELEGFGLTVIESMLAGLIPLVSEKTGACDAVRQVDNNLIFPLEIGKIKDKIMWALSLTTNERVFLSKKSQEIGKTYNRENSVPNLKKELIKYL